MEVAKRIVMVGLRGRRVADDAAVLLGNSIEIKDFKRKVTRK